MLSKYGNCACVRVCSKLKTSWKSVVFTNEVGKNSRYFVGVFNKTIIPLVLVGYEMIIANSYPTRTCGIIVKYTLTLTFFSFDVLLLRVLRHVSLTKRPERSNPGLHDGVPPLSFSFFHSLALHVFSSYLLNCFDISLPAFWAEASQACQDGQCVSQAYFCFQSFYKGKEAHFQKTHLKQKRVTITILIVLKTKPIQRHSMS